MPRMQPAVYAGVPDEASIGRYYQSPEYISHTNTDKGLLNQLYQRVRRFTLQQKAALVVSTQRKGVGCLTPVPVLAPFFRLWPKKDGR
jgi:hypothetical protein